MSQEILKKLEELQMTQELLQAHMAQRLEEIETGLKAEIREFKSSLHDNLSTILDVVKATGKTSSDNARGIARLAQLLEVTDSKLTVVRG